MNGFLKFVGVLVVGTVIVTACGEERSARNAQAAQRQVLTSQLQENDGNRNLLVRTIEGRRGQVSFLQQQITEQQNALAQFRGRVEAYMMNHKMAIAALVIGGAGIGVALNEGNEFTPDQEFYGGVAAFIAVAYALANAQEVMQVADQLIQADAHFKRLEGHLAATRQQLDAELTQLRQEEQQLAALNRQSSEIRDQLAALG